jgi:choline kinase
MKNTKVIILAAGEGKRLRPKTIDTPKCMIKLFGKTILEHQIDVFKKLGITDISVVTGYKNNKIKISGINYFHNELYDTTNMVETLFCAEKKIFDSVIVSYGDIIFTNSVVEKIYDSDFDFSIIVDKEWKSYWSERFIDPLSDAESLKLDNDGYITDIGQKSDKIDEIQGQFIGLMKFQNSAISSIKYFYKKWKKESKTGKNPINPSITFEKSYMTDFLQGLIKENCNLKAVEIKNGWLELDTINDYNLYQNMEKIKLYKFFNSNL